MYTPRKDESPLEAIEHELYDPRKKIEESYSHAVKQQRTLELPTSWGDSPLSSATIEPERGTSFGIKLLLFSVLLFITTSSFAAWRVFSSRNVVSNENIEMVTDVAPSVEGGEIIPLTLTLGNKNTSPLEDVTLTLSGAQEEQEKVQEKRSLARVNSGEYKRQDFSLVFYGGESEARDVSLKLEYKVAGSNAVFSKIVTKTIVLKTPPISVQIEGPALMSSGQSESFQITIKNNSATTSLPSLLQLTIPNSLTVTSSTPKPLSRGTVWKVPALLPGDSKTITITGVMQGKQGEAASIRALIGSQGDSPTSVGIIYASQTVDIKVRSSPLVLTANLDTDSGTFNSLRYGDRATIVLEYTNASDMPLYDASLRFSLEGDAAIYDLVDPTSGYYDSINKVITWDKSILPELEMVPPQKKGTLRVFIPIISKGTNSPTLRTTLVAKAAAQGEEDVTTTISNAWVVQGSASVQKQTAYKNSSFENTGPVPPKPNIQTTYTARIAVSAQNALVNTKVSFTLPFYVTWRGVLSDAEKITYDAKTRTVTWNIGALAAGTKTLAEIGLAVKPSQSHVGTSPAITGGIVLNADEEISKAHLKTTLSPLTTALSDTEDWPTNPSQVVDR
jgi:Domain of unknown function DUF11